VPDLDCSTDPNICQSLTSCDKLEPKLSPVGFLIEGGSHSGGQSLFSINSSEYVYQADGKCQFAIAENKLDKFNNKNFILGQLFLKHFYTVFNYENEQISLGVNTESKGRVNV
jgi:hypothetical protein